MPALSSLRWSTSQAERIAASRIGTVLLMIGLLNMTSSAQDAVSTVDDPAGDGWSTELLQESANAQLTRLAQWIETRTLGPSESLQELAIDGVRIADLRPTDLKSVYEDSAVRVLRAAGEPTNRTPHTSLGSLRSTIKTLRGRDPDSVRVKFKIYRIAVQSDAFQTRQLCWLYVRNTKGTREVHATWRINWNSADPQATPRITSIALDDYEETQTIEARESLFTDCTGAVFQGESILEEQFGHGVDYWSNRLLHVGTEGMQGLAIGDANGDGLEDVYVCQISPLPNRLFIQNQDGTVSERGREFGVDWLEPTHSALFVDLDNDGDQDLLVSTRAALLVMENDGRGKFADRLTFPAARNAYSLSAADYDNDGDLDVFACVYLARARHREILAVPVPFHDARNGGRNVLLRNEGSWKFDDATAETGLEAEATRRSFASSWEDYDNDGDMDLYVANDYGRNNLFRNDDGRFIDVAAEAGVEDQSFGMSASWGDFDRDGWMDLYVSNMFSAAGNRIVYQRQFREGDEESLRRKFQYMARGNSLFRNTGHGDFDDVSLSAATNVAYWAWGSQFVDLNNDSYQDLVVTNGFLTRDDTRDL